jgi:hypothetical protein
MWNLDDDVVFNSNFDVFLFQTIIIIVWNSRIFFIFSSIQIVFAKSLKSFQILFSLTMLILFIREFIFFDVNIFNKTFFVLKNSFDNFDEFDQKEVFF